MTGLLVSVRDVAEATIALDHGVDIIDVKEPHRGSLGAANGETIREIGRLLRGRAVMSVALGEVVAQDESARGDCDVERRRLTTDDVLADATYAKLGLAGCAHVDDWQQRWREQLNALPSHVSPVAVAYADWRSSATPSPHDILRVGHDFGCRTLLIDTHDKTRGALFDLLTRNDVDEIIRAAHRNNVQVVIAGSLTTDSVQVAIGLDADYVAVRGAACVGTRTSQLSAERVANLMSLLRDARACKQL